MGEPAGEATDRNKCTLREPPLTSLGCDRRPTPVLASAGNSWSQGSMSTALQPGPWLGPSRPLWAAQAISQTTAIVTLTWSELGGTTGVGTPAPGSAASD